VKFKPLLTGAFFVFTFFCLAGGPLLVAGYSGAYSLPSEVKVALPAPFFVGLLAIGFLGGVGAVKSLKVGNWLWFGVGLFMIVFCYFGVELFYGIVGGDLYFG
jgi:hypothetical protein